MSDLICNSCGSSNSPDLVYCARCGDTLERSSAPVSGTAGAAALVNRGEVRAASDPTAGLSFFPLLLFRLRKVFLHLVLVGIGVLVVLAFMDPKDQRLSERRVLDAKTIVRRVFEDARSAPSTLSQSTVNSFLSLQAPYTLQSPTDLVPMPVWSLSRVELLPSRVRTHVTLTLFGFPMRISEIFQVRGFPGSWSMRPESASAGLIGVPGFLLPLLTWVTRPAYFCAEKELADLAASQSLVIRPGSVEFSMR